MLLRKRSRRLPRCRRLPRRPKPRSLDDHQRFETIVAALVPDNATEEGIMSTIAELLGGLHWEQIDRAQKRNLTNDGSAGAFSRATKISRKRRKDYRGWGRGIAIDFWHKQTRLA